MAAVNSKRAAFVLTLAVITASVASPAVRAQAPGVDPVAVEILQRMTDYLSNLQQFSVHTDTTLEDLLDSGQRIDFSVATDVVSALPAGCALTLGADDYFSAFSCPSADV